MTTRETRIGRERERIGADKQNKNRERGGDVEREREFCVV